MYICKAWDSERVHISTNSDIKIAAFLDLEPERHKNKISEEDDICGSSSFTKFWLLFPSGKFCHSTQIVFLPNSYKSGIPTKLISAKVLTSTNVDSESNINMFQASVADISPA